MKNFPKDLSKFDAITFHFDGNNNDLDDIAALPMAASIAKSAGLEKKISFFYGNNLSEPSDGKRVKAMRESAAFAEKLGIDTHSYQDGIQKTTNELVKILDSGKKVLAIEGGPMEAIYRAIAQTSPKNRDNITLISHGTWNEVRDVGTRPGGGKPRTWDDLRRDFPEVERIEIRDQNNGSNNNKGFNSFKWNWLDNTKNPVLQEARDKMKNAGAKVNDPSDAGMLFYAITGKEAANPDQAKAFFDQNPPTFGSSPAPKPSPTPKPRSSGGGNDVFMAQNGQLVIEAESAKPAGDWRAITVGGEKSLIWDPANSSYRKVPTGQTLTYQFETDEAGAYNIGLHSGRVKSAMNRSDRYKNGKGGQERNDTGNDTYVSIINAETGAVVQKPTKLFTVLGSSDKTLKWGTEFDINHKKPAARVKLDKNTRYRLEISGRSDGYVLDRITLSNDGALKSTNAPQSPLKGNSPAPKPDPKPDPAPKPTPAPSPTEPLITFALADAGTDNIVKGFENLGSNSVINLTGLNLKKYTLVAQVNPDHPEASSVKSVRFESDFINRTDNVKPYALFGDTKGNLLGETLDTGDYSVKAVAYTQKNGKGRVVESSDLNYLVVESMADAIPDPAPAPTPEPTPVPTPLPEPTPDPTDPLLTLALVNAETDKVVKGFENLATNSEIDLADLDFTQFSLAARVNPDHPDAGSVKSVKFDSDFGKKTENLKPYALFGDKGGKGNFTGKTLDTGDFSVRATAYTKQGAKGRALESLDLDYSVIESMDNAAPAPKPKANPTPVPNPNPTPIPTPKPKLTPAPADPLMRLALVNAKTDKVVKGYEDLATNSEIDMADLDTSQYNLVALVNSDHSKANSVKSVKFEANFGNGSKFSQRTENVEPYALFGDKGGDFFEKTLTPGDVTIKAKAYSKDGGKGAVVDILSLDYSVIDTDSVQTSMVPELHSLETFSDHHCLSTADCTAQTIGDQSFGANSLAEQGKFGTGGLPGDAGTGSPELELIVDSSVV
ncbi:MAG: hypothetical protein AAFU84_10960 [Cyanobacteria bacterium J06633_23]